MNKTEYESKINTMLADTNTYTHIPNDTTTAIKLKSDNLINYLHSYDHLTSKQATNLTNFKPKCPTFYGIPKIHKPHCPLRPIVSQINGPTSNIHKLIDKYLKTAESRIPNLLQDTTSFLNLLQQKQYLLQPNTILVTLDVTSLYTNIPHKEGIEEVCNFYEESLSYWNDINLQPIPQDTLKKLLTFCLNNTIFTFNNNYYTQNYGCTMGAQSSVKYANIYMHKFLTKFRAQYQQYLPDFFARLVDDVFTLWNSDLDSLKTFVEQLNQFHPTIKFELNYSYTEITFLDTLVYIENNLLKTKVYTKPTDKKQYLHFSSSHPQHIKSSIPYSQALRYRRIITDNSILKTSLNNLVDKFLCRNYPKTQVQLNVNKVLLLNRSQTLVYKTKSQKQDIYSHFIKGDTFLPFIITYHPTLTINHTNNLKTILSTEWFKLLDENPILKTSIGNNTPQIVYKKHKTISSYLSTSTYPIPWLMKNKPNSNTSNHCTITKCNHPLCKCCRHLTDLTHNIYNLSHSITTPINFTCNSKNIIYLIHCNKCHLNYIGETKRTLKERLNNHRSNIKNNKPTAISIHFNLPQHTINNLQIMPIQTVSTNSDYERKKYEKQWMKILHTTYPSGLNYYPIIYKQ